MEKIAQFKLVLLWRQFPQSRKRKSRVNVVLDNSEEEIVCIFLKHENLQTPFYTSPLMSSLPLEFWDEVLEMVRSLAGYSAPPSFSLSSLPAK